MDFIKEHKKLVIFLAVFLVLLVICLIIRSNNLGKKKSNEVAQESAKPSIEAIVTEPPVTEEPSSYSAQLGIDAEKDDRIKVDIATEAPPTPSPTPVQKTPTYPVSVNVFDHTNVPKTNVDGSSCKAYLSQVTLDNFGSFWGSQLTKKDYFGNKILRIGVEQSGDDYDIDDLESFGWLIDNLDTLKPNDAIKFVNLHVIGSLSDTHVAKLCSYDWYSAFGLKDTLLVFEDISGTLKNKDLKAGDVFSATIYRHNLKVMNVNGQRVIVVQYATFDSDYRVYTEEKKKPTEPTQKPYKSDRVH